MTEVPPIVLLTLQFPFGDRSETFLEDEIEVLAARFPAVLVLPSQPAGPPRRLPANVELVHMDWLSTPSMARRKAALLSPAALEVATSTVRAGEDPRPYMRAMRPYADRLARNLLKLRSLRRLVRTRGLQRAIFYDYWFENSTLALAMLRRSGEISTAIARAHRFDLYDEDWPAGVVPFRAAKLRGLDAVFPVSDHGRRYLHARSPGTPNTIELARLGVADLAREGALVRNGGAPPLVLTCGALIRRKAIDLVPKVLEAVGRPLRWVHLGDGPLRERVLHAAARLPPSVAWELPGHVRHDEVRHFYEQHRVAALLSLSTSEGVPVSMMEAQSYGVPVVARAVGGVPEIVNERTGVALAPDATPADFAAALATAIEPGRFAPEAIRSFFLENFEASLNYNRFADRLIALHGRE